MSRRVQIFAAVLCIAALVFWVSPVPPLLLWPAALVAATLLALAVGPGGGLEALLDGSRTEFLCDRCAYNNERDCARPERPNARRCPEFRSRIR